MEDIKTSKSMNKNFSRELKIGERIEIDKDFIVEKVSSKKIYKAKDYNLEGREALICKDGILTVSGFSIATIRIPKFNFSGYDFKSIAQVLDNHLNRCYFVDDMILDYNSFLISEGIEEKDISEVKETILSTLNRILISEKEVISLTELEIRNLSTAIMEDLDKEFNLNYLFEHEAYWNDEDIKYEYAINSISDLLSKIF